jgi:hypothetical protein
VAQARRLAAGHHHDAHASVAQKRFASGPGGLAAGRLTPAFGERLRLDGLELRRCSAGVGLQGHGTPTQEGLEIESHALIHQPVTLGSTELVPVVEHVLLPMRLKSFTELVDVRHLGVYSRHLAPLAALEGPFSTPSGKAQGAGQAFRLALAIEGFYLT